MESKDRDRRNIPNINFVQTLCRLSPLLLRARELKQLAETDVNGHDGDKSDENISDYSGMNTAKHV